MGLADVDFACGDRWRGVYPWRELRRRGLTQHQVSRLVDGGDLRVLRRGWYAAGGAHPLVAASVSAGGVCSCVTALDLHGVWVTARRDRVHVRARKAAHNAGGRHYCIQFGGPEPEVYPLDDVATSLRHALRCLDDESIVAACDSILNQRLLDMSDLVEIFASAPQRIRRLLALCDSRADSGTETIVRLRFRGMGLRFEIQVTIAGVGRVDLLVGDRLIVEIDSEEFHDRSAQQRERDRRRDEKALLLGYLTLRVSYKRVMSEWSEVADTVTDLVRRRDHRKALAGPRDLQIEPAHPDPAVDPDPGVDPDPRSTSPVDAGEATDGTEYWRDGDFEGC